MEQIARAWDIECEENGPKAKRIKHETVNMSHEFHRNHFKQNGNWPKRALESFRKRNEKRMDKPIYDHVQRKSDNRYQATITLRLDYIL